MRRAAQVIGIVVLVLVAIVLIRTYLDEREHSVVIDSIEFLNSMPNSYRVTAHSPSTTYTLTCTNDFGGGKDEQVCEQFSVGQKIRYETMGDLFRFFGEGRNDFKSWKIENEKL
jgi:hypothetical protein